MCGWSRSRRQLSTGLALGLALVIAGLLGCAGEPPELPAEITVALRGHQDVELCSDGSVRPLAYSQALAAVRSSHVPAAWANLMLVQGAAGSATGGPRILQDRPGRRVPGKE